MASLSLQGIQKIYPNGFHAVKDFNLEIADKEFIIFVGPSGCGKSTTLRMIAGLEDISGGTFKIDGKVMNDVEPKDRDIAMVFQNYALYPHMTVYDNMAFGLKLRKVPKDEIDKKVREAAKILDLEKLLDRKPKALSGGHTAREAAVFIKKKINEGTPVPYLMLRHKDKKFADFVWHWFLCIGYEETADDLLIKVATYGEATTFSLKELWNTGYKEKGGLIGITVYRNL